MEWAGLGNVAEVTPRCPRARPTLSFGEWASSLDRFLPLQYRTNSRRAPEAPPVGVMRTTSRRGARERGSRIPPAGRASPGAGTVAPFAMGRPVGKRAEEGSSTPATGPAHPLSR